MERNSLMIGSILISMLLVVSIMLGGCTSNSYIESRYLENEGPNISRGNEANATNIKFYDIEPIEGSSFCPSLDYFNIETSSYNTITGEFKLIMEVSGLTNDIHNLINTSNIKTIPSCNLSSLKFGEDLKKDILSLKFSCPTNVKKIEVRIPLEYKGSSFDMEVCVFDFSGKTRLKVFRDSFPKRIGNLSFEIYNYSKSIDLNHSIQVISKEVGKDNTGKEIFIYYSLIPDQSTLFERLYKSEIYDKNGFIFSKKENAFYYPIKNSPYFNIIKVVYSDEETFSPKQFYDELEKYFEPDEVFYSKYLQWRKKQKAYSSSGVLNDLIEILRFETGENKCLIYIKSNLNKNVSIRKIVIDGVEKDFSERYLFPNSITEIEVENCNPQGTASINIFTNLGTFSGVEIVR